MTTDSYEFIIGTIPGATDDRDLVVKCQQCVYPGVGHDNVEMPLHGYVINFRGRKTFPRTMSVTYIETRNMGTTTDFENWNEYVVGVNSGTSRGYKNGPGGYAVDGAQIITYDTMGVPVKYATFYGLKPQDKPDVQYDSSSSQLYLVQQTFTYDYYIPSGVTFTPAQ